MTFLTKGFQSGIPYGTPYVYLLEISNISPHATTASHLKENLTSYDIMVT